MAEVREICQICAKNKALNCFFGGKRFCLTCNTVLRDLKKKHKHNPNALNLYKKIIELMEAQK